VGCKRVIMESWSNERMEARRLGACERKSRWDAFEGEVGGRIEDEWGWL
jgi:hypothetical protein